MRVVNEHHRTRRLRFTEADETVEVEFDAAGRAEVSDAVGARLIERYGPIRQAEGPDDVAEAYLAERPWYGVEATPAAVDLAEEAGLRPDEIEGTGEDGRITKGDVQRAIDEVGGAD